jgi:hypothetical protein
MIRRDFPSKMAGRVQLQLDQVVLVEYFDL